MSDAEQARAAAYRAAVRTQLAPRASDLGRITLDEPLPPFSGEAVVDLDAQDPQIPSSDALATWAQASGITLIGAASWAVALAAPDDNVWLQRTHARESDLAQVRSWTSQSPTLTEARRLIEQRLAPHLPLGATRRALLHLRAGTDPAVTAGTLAALEARRAGLAGTIAAAELRRWIPTAALLAAALSDAAGGDFRAWGYLVKLAHAATLHGVRPALAALLEEPAAAAAASDLFAKLELDCALQHFAFGWADDPALAELASYRGVRLDDIGINLLLRRFGHPAFGDS